jgi:5-methylcytosine-specific restriction enzyme subunit McrC
MFFWVVNNLINIEAFDCLPFCNETASANVLQAFIKSQTNNIFWFSNNYNADEDAKLAEYDYRSNNWVAGRFVGEAIFSHNNNDYKIIIKPRFGEKVLLRMLEEIFNIKITSSASKHNKSDEWQHYIKKIIAFIWLQKLANANLHGVPKVQVIKSQKGKAIRGRLNVKESLKPFNTSNEVVSIFREKQIDSSISQIIFQAYQILKSNFEIGKINIPDSAQEAINQIYSSITTKVFISENDYKNISYKDIYLSWKPIVDLSWDIIKRNQLSLKQDKAKNGIGFFIDMAEVWEQYLRATLKKKLFPYGWHYKNEKQVAYKGYFYQRELIPDLVFQKENNIAIWDAKYKRMLGRYFDVDRSDFFQIHTYIQYHLNHKNVKASGLLYPISTTPNFDNYSTPFLINNEGMKVNFSIDGVVLNEEEDNENMKIKEAEFINRIVKSIT